MPLSYKLSISQKTELLTDIEAHRRKLLFLCKRGNLESELLLIAFVEALDLQLSPQKNQLFETFLNENDQNLLCWLLKHNPQAPSQTVGIPTEYQALIDEIRLNYLNKPSLVDN
ncbi:FAD assembly factor SdhE [Thiomicrorhabdus arctica]|uniref:FAD assembly factor SdhE n=1 Tax=Thiomicrorhabdus arctica TaxID=131540 RepID=UPI00035FFFEF|nr:succinate dehydrogenase assembly factor 2 [Thiomicrorhabdus arctica]